MTDLATMSEFGSLADEVQRDFPVASRLLALRLAETGDRPLVELRTGATTITALGSKLAAALPGEAPRLAAELAGGGTDRLAKVMSRALSRYLMRKNQYLLLPQGWDGAAEQLYALFLEEFAADAGDRPRATAALIAHQRRLRALLAVREADGGFDDEPVCATYSTELQLHLLRLDPHRLPGPILDIGCGESGALVRHLRSLGRADAWGLDALCETEGPLVRGSWLDVRMKPGSFGTIIAHQSFSLHLLRAHLLGSQSSAERHVRAFKTILDALSPGGAFHYAPSLPFLERLLPPERWSVRRWPIAGPDVTNPFEATRIEALSTTRNY